MNQSQALEILKTGKNVFLTGEPGSGKSHTINTYVTFLKQQGIGVAITASTGIAATHIGGVTIHSWSGLGIKKHIDSHDAQRLLENPRLIKRTLQSQVLIIDEISMIEARILEMVNLILKTIRQQSDPFGGMQIVLVGDFFQLPPVSKPNESVEFAFQAEAWREAELTVCYLTEQHRQSDDRLTQILKAIRTGDISEWVYEILQSRKPNLERNSTPQTDTKTRLYAHNQNVDLLNQQRLQLLSGQTEVFTMHTSGPFPLIDQLKAGCLSPSILHLKPGAFVMFTKNNYDVGYVNGTLGQVVAFKEGLPIVQTKDGRLLVVEPVTWSIEDNGRVLASISQIPLRLAWALTVHKSQGMTLDSAIVDLSKAFAYGQGYVAISRVRTLSGLALIGMNQRAFEVDPQILETDREFYRLSSQAEYRYGSEHLENTKKLQLEFITTYGQLIIKHTKSEAGASTELTYELFTSGKTIDEIATERNLKTKTIIGHLEDLKTQGKLSVNDLERILPLSLRALLPEIHDYWKQNKDYKLKPAFERFNGKISYEELQLARLVY